MAQSFVLLYNKKEQIKSLFYPSYRNGFSKYVKACGVLPFFLTIEVDLSVLQQFFRVFQEAQVAN